MHVLRVVYLPVVDLSAALSAQLVQSVSPAGWALASANNGSTYGLLSVYVDDLVNPVVSAPLSLVNVMDPVNSQV